MYKNKYFIISIIMICLILPVVLAQTPSQDLADMIHRALQTTTKDIAEDVNRNMDENFGQLDQRIMENQKGIFRKAIFSLLGGMTVVIFGYAFVVNRVTRRYDFNFYEKMIDSKLSKLQQLGTSRIIASDDTFFRPMTKMQFDTRYISPEGYFERHFDVDKETIEEQNKKITAMQKVIDEYKKIENKGLFKRFRKKKKEKLEKEIYDSVLTQEEKEIIGYSSITKKGKLKMPFTFNKKSITMIIFIVLVLGIFGLYLYLKFTGKITGFGLSKLIGKGG